MVGESSVGVNLLGMSLDELRALAVRLGEPAYRGGQIYNALYAERQLDVAAMSNLPLALRANLSEEAPVRLPKIVRRYHSADDRT